jgi:hypothetical protein
MAKTQAVYKRTTISLRNDEYEILRFLAFKQKTSVAGVVRGLINEAIEDQEDIKDGLKALQEESVSLDWETFKKEQLGL